MSEREEASEIEDAATIWVTKAERGLTAEEQIELDRWLEGDSRRLGAFVRAQAVWIHAERAGSLGKMPEPPVPGAGAGEPSLVSPAVPRFLTRRALIGGGGAIAASAVAITAVGWPRYRTIESAVGETRHITLPDGPVLTLDTNTRVDLSLGSNDGSVILRYGQLLVEAIGMPRALTVNVGDLAIKAIKSTFVVMALRDRPLVALASAGGLSVSQRIGFFARSSAVTVDQGQALTIGPDERLSATDVHPVSAAKVAQLLAWKDGMLSFGGETIAEAVRSFDRYGGTRIVVDTSLSRQRVTGLFKADDPKGFATAIAASFDGVANTQGDVIRLTSKKVPGR